MSTYQCLVCGWIYDEAAGCPEDGIAPGTRWEEIADDWCCPHCGVGKSDFETISITVETATPDQAKSAEATAMRSDALVILGSGLAAYTLAREFRKLDSQSPMTLVSRDDGCFYAKPALSNALANHKTPDQLQNKTAEQMATELTAEIHAHVEVTAIDPANRQIILSDGRPLTYGRLVIACGADPIRISFEGDAANAAQSVNDLDDYRRFYSGLANAKSVAVIGAGLIGCEFANDLASRQIKAHLIDPSAWPLSRLLPEAAGQSFAAGLQKQGVDFHFSTSVKGIWTNNNGFRLELTDGQQIEADQILSAIGLRPRTTLAKAAGITCQRGIVTDQFLQTNIADIFAMGDCAEISGLLLPFVLPIMHQAYALARTLTGTVTALHYPAMPVVVKTPACPTVVCPPAAGAIGDWECHNTSDGLQANFRNISGELLGFALLGSATTQSQTLAAQIPATLN